MPTEFNLESSQLKKLINNMELYVADGWENGKFFVSKKAEIAKQTQSMFHKLWNNEITTAENQQLGRLLGYPETAVTQDFSQPKGLFGKIRQRFTKQVDPTLDRHYTHSAEHQKEEFDAYERPIHQYMEQVCPEATKCLKAKKTTKGKLYRWQ